MGLRSILLATKAHGLVLVTKGVVWYFAVVASSLIGKPMTYYNIALIFAMSLHSPPVQPSCVAVGESMAAASSC